MRLRDTLNSILDRGAKVKILRVLSSPGLELTGRQIAAEARLSVQTCARALQELVRIGLLDLTRRGRAHVYRVRHDYDIVSHGLVPLFRAERVLYRNAIAFLKEQLEHRVVAAVLFGSYARGEEEDGSDFDVFLLVQRREEAEAVQEYVQRRAGDFHRRFGVVLAPYVKDLRAFRAMVREGVPVAREILARGQLLFGRRLRGLVE